MKSGCFEACDDVCPLSWSYNREGRFYCDVAQINLCYSLYLPHHPLPCCRPCPGKYTSCERKRYCSFLYYYFSKLLKHLTRSDKVVANVKCVIECQTQVNEKLDKVNYPRFYLLFLFSHLNIEPSHAKPELYELCDRRRSLFVTNSHHHI